MLASSRTKATYTKLQQQGIASTVCRGTSGDDFNFFYSDLSYWSDSCLGWVPDFVHKPKICTYCLVAVAPLREFETKEEVYDTRKKLRDVDRSSGQANEPGKPRRRELSKLPASSEHCRKGIKSDAKPKNKKSNESTVKKFKKTTKKL